ncbi:hypothetical protein AN459_05275 [Pseudomonas aeruginosa]|nr:hypothetical protein AN457_27970 [Pseudomonas aeruginosa]KRV20903.1 hypothetical protein AN459_05275 [Pseudomonas aeruginosa]WPB09195.1 hypothetical protein [Cloning vector pMA11O17]
MLLAPGPKRPALLAEAISDRGIGALAFSQSLRGPSDCFQNFGYLDEQCPVGTAMQRRAFLATNDSDFVSDHQDCPHLTGAYAEKVGQDQRSGFVVVAVGSEMLEQLFGVFFRHFLNRV